MATHSDGLHRTRHVPHKATRDTHLRDESIRSLLGELMRLALIAQASNVDNQEGMPLLVLSLPSHLHRQSSMSMPGLLLHWMFRALQSCSKQFQR